MGDYMEIGKLPGRGDFLPERGIPIFPAVPPLTPAEPRLLGDRTICYNQPDKSAAEEKVYGYRSGRLVRGTLYAAGNFKPEVGSKVTSFKDYNPERFQDLRIDNLPGVLKRLPPAPAKK